jgi:glycine reductase
VKSVRPIKKLEIGNFHVKDIIFGEKTSFKSGVLTVNKEEAIACTDPDGVLKNIELYIIRPGDSVRVMPVKAAVEPRFRPDGRSIFPGFTGPISSCGDGALYAMKDMSVLCCGKYAC